MRTTEVRYTRKYNLGNYEAEEYSATAVLEEDDNSVEAMIQLKEDVAAAYGGASPAVPADEETETPAKKKKAGKKVAGKKSKQEPEEDDEDESSDDEEQTDEDSDDDMETDDSETDTDSDDEDEEEVSPKKKPVGKTGKKFKKKPQTYDRGNETHKDIFSNLLKSVAPDWKKTEAGKKKAKDASVKGEGREFLDENGEVLESFKKLLKTWMKK